MKNFLKNLFAGKNKNIQDKNIKNNYISFLIDQNNEPALKISIVNTDHNSAKIFAEMLHDIISGEYEYNMLDLLLQIGENDNTIKEFVSHVMLYYSVKKTDTVLGQSLKIDKPLIKPTEFNKRL